MVIIILLLGNLVQGNCKHTFVIRDMRLIHPEDVHNRAGYPIVLFQLKFRVQKCNVCKIYRATKVTVNDKWALKNPCYFCKDCYFLFLVPDNMLLKMRILYFPQTPTAPDGYFALHPAGLAP